MLVGVVYLVFDYSQVFSLVIPEFACPLSNNCSQSCVLNTGAEECSCNRGFVLENDATTCSGRILLPHANMQ